MYTKSLVQLIQACDIDYLSCLCFYLRVSLVVALFTVEQGTVVKMLLIDLLLRACQLSLIMQLYLVGFEKKLKWNGWMAD
jgi:hypothetical protein